jgi:hypothetical protein
MEKALPDYSERLARRSSSSGKSETVIAAKYAPRLSLQEEIDSNIVWGD